MAARWIAHPFLLGVFPCLFLYAQNTNETSARELIVPVVIVLVSTLLLWRLLRRALGDSQRAGLLVSLLWLFFFSFGRWPDLLEAIAGTVGVHADWAFRQRTLLPFGILLVVALGYLVVRKLKQPEPLTSFLNVASLVLLVFPLVSIGTGAEPRQAVAIQPTKPVPLDPQPDARPDIYYIILDGYARSDVLREYFGFDNRPFLERLEKRGFYVARQSTANYGSTPLCLASSLNMRYLDEVAGSAARDVGVLRPLVGQNAVIESLRPLGYKFVTVSTGFDITDHPSADVYLTPELGGLSAFHTLLLGTTPLGPVVQRASASHSYKKSRARTLHALKWLPAIALKKEPTFAFVHILTPHPPFLFGPQGEDVSPYGKSYLLTDGSKFLAHYGDARAYKRGYRQQVEFITARVEQTIDRILASSPKPPVIILQSDHGSGLGLDINSLRNTDLHERMSILNAYYLPGVRKTELYAGISPVNSFRVVFNQYFGAKLPLVDDRSYFSTWRQPFLFTDVTDHVRSRSLAERGNAMRGLLTSE